MSCTKTITKRMRNVKIDKQFKRRITEEEQKMGNNLKIIIVCNMLLTGFDALSSKQCI